MTVHARSRLTAPPTTPASALHSPDLQPVTPGRGGHHEVHLGPQLHQPIHDGVLAHAAGAADHQHDWLRQQHHGLRGERPHGVHDGARELLRVGRLGGGGRVNAVPQAGGAPAEPGVLRQR